MKLISKNNGNFFWLDQKISFSETVKFRLVRNTAHAKLKISLGFAKEIENFDWMNHRVWFTMAYECDPLTYVHRGFPLALRRILRRTVSMGSLCIVVTCLEIRCTPSPSPPNHFSSPRSAYLWMNKGEISEWAGENKRKRSKHWNERKLRMWVTRRGAAAFKWITFDASVAWLLICIL